MGNLIVLCAFSVFDAGAFGDNCIVNGLVIRFHMIAHVINCERFLYGIRYDGFGKAVTSIAHFRIGHIVCDAVSGAMAEIDDVENA